jgi:hypothetical protein
MYLAAHLPPVLPAQNKHQRHIIVELGLVARLAQLVQRPLVTTRTFSALGRERGRASGFCLLGRRGCLRRGDGSSGWVWGGGEALRDCICASTSVMVMFVVVVRDRLVVWSCGGGMSRCRC